MTVQHWPEWLGWILVHSLWQGVALALALAVTLWLIPRARSTVRYAASVVTLCAMVAAPLATGLVSARTSSAVDRSVSIDEPVAAATVERDVVNRRVEPLLESVPRVFATRVPLHITATDVVEGLRPWLPVLAMLWAFGASLLSVRLAGGWLLLRRVTRTHVIEAPEAWRQQLAVLRTRLGVQRPVRLLVSPAVVAPLLIGWWRPVILLPASALSGLAPWQLELLLQHELVHIRRYDYLVNLLQSTAEVLLFHHPAAWWVSRQIRAEREHCCDDQVVSAAGVRPYVQALVAMEELRGRQQPAFPALAIGADGGTLVARVARLVARHEAGTPNDIARPGVMAVVGSAAVPVLLSLGLLLAATTSDWRAGAMRALDRSGATPALHADCVNERAQATSTLCTPLTEYVGALLQRRRDVAAVVVQEVGSGAVVSYTAADGADDPQITAALTPASVWKLSLAALWWEHGLADRTVPCPARLEIGGRVVEHAGAPRAAMTAHEMLVSSCNTAAARMALVLRERLGVQGLRVALDRLGFPSSAATGSPASTTDADFWATASTEWRARMSPSRAVVRVPATENEAEWAGLGMGQGVTLSPLHVARLLQAIGNDGRMRRPTVERTFAAQADSGVRIMRAETARRLRVAMREAVQRGTASEAALPLRDARWELGGKTGTWQASAGAPLDGWFAGLLFDERQVPRYAVVVFVRGKGHGGGASAEIAVELTRALGGHARARSQRVI